MNQPLKETVNYNSAYISLNLLDELDYYLGGYAKPNVEFIFSLNTFVESFIGCSEFYTSLDELNHLNLTAPALFPGGRPILNMVVKETGLKFVSGVVDSPGRVIYSEHTDGLTRKQAEQEFITSYGKIIQDQYFIKGDLQDVIEKIPLITSSFEDNKFTVSEVLSTSYDLVANLIKVSNTTSIQTTIPIYLFNAQINALSKTPYSIASLERIAKIHDTKAEDLKKSLGITYMPIPPFTNILLSQISSVSEIPSKLTQLRADFRELRDKFIELEINIYESDTMKHQLDAFRKFKEFWSVFNSRYVDKTNRLFYGHLDIAEGADLEKGLDAIIEGDSLTDALKDVTVSKLIGNTLNKAYTWNRDRRIINRFKGLTNIWELFQNSKSISQQLGHFERIFGVKYSVGDINKVHDYMKRNLTDITSNIKL